MKFIGKIKESIKRKNNKKLSQLEALLENETTGSKYTLDELKSMAKGVQKFMKAFRQQLKQRRREDRRRLTVEWIGGIFAFVVINGSIIFLGHQTGIIELLIDEWGLGRTLFGLIIAALWIGFALLLASTFFWLSDKTGLHYLIEDWVVSWDTFESRNIHKYRKFPRRKRRALIRDLKKELDVFTDQLYRLENEAYDTDDEKLSDSVENINQVIGSLVTEADISSRSLVLQPERASWKGFVLSLEETSNELELELKDIAKYHKSIQPLLKLASNITSKALYRIIDSGNDKGKAAII